MSLQKTLYAIRGAAHEQRALADQCIHAPRVKASSLQNAADMDEAAKYVEELNAENTRLRALLGASLQDTARVDFLKEHTHFEFWVHHPDYDVHGGKRFSAEGVVFREVVDSALNWQAKNTS